MASSVVPSGWFAPEPEAPEAPAVVLEAFTTRGHDGADFARISVVWIEVDGERLREDAWGEGHVESLRFKVGVKRADGNALLLGDRTVALAPTDVFTVRDFTGRFSFADVGTSDATLALDGTVRNTRVSEGAGDAVATRGRADRAFHGPERLAYVALDTGQAVGTLEVEPGGVHKLFTGPSTTPVPAATPIDVRWAKFDGVIADRYSYGDGELGLVEFQPDARFPTRLNFSGHEVVFGEGDRVQVREFLGAWNLVQRPGGGARLRLDGWAGAVDILRGDAAPNAAPSVSFTFTPAAPTTRDLVAFTADGFDADGTIVQYQWTFLRRLPDGAADHAPEDILAATANGQTVQHRFARPGTWEVTLRAVDDTGAVATAVQDVAVGNTAATAAFDWTPNAPVTLETIRFFDRSTDLDGGVASRRWDFGDGTTSTEKDPQKAYTANGLYHVSLTATDTAGATSTTTHLVNVRNAAPDCAFHVVPSDPVAFSVTELLDASSDREGPIASWSWTVRDLDNASIPVKTYDTREAHHTFLAADLHRVTLTVADGQGASATCTQDVQVRNTPPIAGFTWWPTAPATREWTYLNATGSDPDGRIVKWEWTIEGDPAVRRGPRIGYQFPRAETFRVTLTVTDNGGLTNSVTQQIGIENSAPIASFTWFPLTPRTGEEVRFTNTSRDVDGDAQVSWVWDFGASEDPPTDSGPQVVHRFRDDGTFPVKLTVTDSEGKSRSITQDVAVLNRAPTGSIQYAPSPATVADNITFTAEATDPDGSIVRYEWLFGDGARAEGAVVGHQFAEPGPYETKLILTDDDGAQSEVPLGLTIRRAGPIADFDFDPEVGATGRAVEFRDLSVTRGAQIRTWAWTFGDGGTSALASPSHVFTLAGSYPVTLTVTDEDGTTDSVERTLAVTNPPEARFRASTLTPQNGGSVTFTDESFDPDGVIASRQWLIDGADAGNAAEFSYVFTGRGVHPVRLTVVDDDGVASHRFENITVQNVAPTASFGWNPDPIIAGEPVTFFSTSTDPDGTLVPGKTRWGFVDILAPSSPDPMEWRTVIQNGGFYTVTLRVEDDAGTADTHSEIVVAYANSPVTYALAFRYADNSIPSLAGVAVEFCNTRSRECWSIADAGLTVDATRGFVLLRLERGAWVPGDTWLVTIGGPTGPQEFRFGSFESDALADPAIVRTIIFPRFLAPPALTVAPGAREGSLGLAGPLLVLGAQPGVYYATGSEQVRGSVHATWVTPAAPVEGGRVQLWMNRSLFATPLQVRIPILPVDAQAAGLSVKTEGMTDASGRLDFTMPFMLEGAGLTSTPPGWYTIDALVTWPGQIGYVRPVRATADVYVDLEGVFQAIAGRGLP